MHLSNSSKALTRVIKAVTYLASESRTPPTFSVYLTSTYHGLHNNVQLPSNEEDIQLATLSINARQLQSNRRAAAIFNVPETTLRDRRAGKPA